MRNPLLEPRARTLRSQTTPAELRLWYVVNRRPRKGMKFRRQYVIGPYILDFYCVERRLAIEVDGSGHAEPAQLTYDTERGRFLESRGVQLLRFWNHDVFQNLEEVVAQIDAALDNRLPPPALRATSPVREARHEEVALPRLPPPALRATSPVNGGGQV
jgi:very-short-patch-repair endonuclease